MTEHSLQPYTPQRRRTRNTRARTALALCVGACLALTALTACTGGQAEAEIRNTISGFFTAVADQDFQAAEEYFVDMPEGSLALLNPQAPPKDALGNYEIRSVSIQEKSHAEAEVAIPGAEGSPGTTVLTFSLQKVEGRWLLEEEIQARVELD